MFNKEECLKVNKVASRWGQSNETYGKDIINTIAQDLDKVNCVNCKLGHPLRCITYKMLKKLWSSEMVEQKFSCKSFELDDERYEHNKELGLI